MATVIRLKRKRNEDPLQVLYLATKKRRKNSNEDFSQSRNKDENVFKYAGTVGSKGEGISKHVRDAIRKEKLEKEFRKNQIDIVGNVRSQARQNATQASQKSRYKVVARQRAQALDKLDDLSEKALTDDTTASSNISANSCENDRVTSPVCDKYKLSNNNDKENSDIGSSCARKNVGKREQCSKIVSETKKNTCDSAIPENGAHSRNQDSGMLESLENGDPCEKVYNLVDVVADVAENRMSSAASSSEQITCNSEPLVRETVAVSHEDDDYVYDIYYTNSRDFDFRQFERDLTFEAFNNDFMNERESDEVEDEFVYGDDDDDENEESNWRNDYPEVDPRYIENEAANCDYGEGLDENLAFESETGGQLAEWMSWRCNIGKGGIQDHCGEEGIQDTCTL
ncbi:probable RNA polymerase II nuclear localization protein SLC7A6OS isoform X2 [Dreissena polymorpha]|uniref:probable RNA polymerase II nuclear localization protein SLC7A6OS isoform X2 n=1 Tax=Dreissena polymorpha TaxID=45954 RepID=UPI0022645287|nr:probable RNA polymerase II nuclear localization protein SLC7A6OS isoform X2 [Dreissena polymorpha]